MTDVRALSGEERDLLAGEYVLGTLDQGTSEQVEAAMARDPAWLASVDAWESHFAALIDVAPPEAPPPRLWTQVEAAIWPHAVPKAMRRGLTWWAWLLRGWALGATVAAIVLAVMLVRPPSVPSHNLVAVLVTDASQPAFLAQIDVRGGLQLAAATSAGGIRPTAAAGRSLQLWGLPPGTKTPRSLGVLPPNAGSFRVSAAQTQAVPDMVIMISQEPEGGSPTGLPTGPVMFYGRLVAAVK